MKRTLISTALASVVLSAVFATPVFASTTTDKPLNTSEHATTAVASNRYITDLIQRTDDQIEKEINLVVQSYTLQSNLIQHSQFSSQQKAELQAKLDSTLQIEMKNLQRLTSQQAAWAELQAEKQGVSVDSYTFPITIDGTTWIFDPLRVHCE